VRKIRPAVVRCGDRRQGETRDEQASTKKPTGCAIRQRCNHSNKLGGASVQETEQRESQGRRSAQQPFRDGHGSIFSQVVVHNLAIELCAVRHKDQKATIYQAPLPPWKMTV